MHHGSPPRKKGWNITYRGAHARIEYERGKPEACEFCGRTGPIPGHKRSYTWALSHDAQLNVRHQGGKLYSVDPADYIRLCIPCHAVYDKAGLPRGWGRIMLHAACGS